jgi:hypothetical protein
LVACKSSPGAVIYHWILLQIGDDFTRDCYEKGGKGGKGGYAIRRA